MATTGRRAPVAESARAADPDMSNATSASGTSGRSSTVRYSGRKSASRTSLRAPSAAASKSDPPGSSSRRPSCVWVAATRSTCSPCDASASAVPGPIAATRFAVTPRRASSCAPLRLVTTSQSYARAATGSSPSGSTRISSQKTASCPSDSTRPTSSSRVTSTRIHQLRPERRGVVARVPLDPRSILRRDEARQRRSVVMCRDRSEAAAADGRHDCTLRFDALASLGVVRGRDELLVAGAHLQRERALARLRQHRLWLEPMPDLAAEPEAVEPARGEHDRIEAPLAPLAQPRVDVAAQRLDGERGLEREQLRLPPHRGRADPHPGPPLPCPAERVAGVLPAGIGADHEPVGIRGSQILGGVDGDVDPQLEQRLLELLDEDAAGADLAERSRAVAITGRRDRDERKLDAGRPQRGERALGLGEREPTAATADADEHRPVASVRAARSQRRAAGLG